MLNTAPDRLRLLLCIRVPAELHRKYYLLAHPRLRRVLTPALLAVPPGDTIPDLRYAVGYP